METVRAATFYRISIKRSDPLPISLVCMDKAKREEEGTPPPPALVQPSQKTNGYRARPAAEKKHSQTPRGVYRILQRKSEIRRKALSREVRMASMW